MHIHLPKPLHGWRKFAGEIAIIVIGVSIALTAEEAVQRWRWYEQVNQSKEAFQVELLDAGLMAFERLAVQPCLQGRLREIANRLHQSGNDWQAMPEKFSGAEAYYSNVLPVVYRPPNRGALTDSWRNALADGTVSHLNSERARNLSGAYSIVQEFMSLENGEVASGAKLGPLGLDGELDQRTRIEMLQTVSELDRFNNALLTGSKELLESIRAANLKFNKAVTQQRRKEFLLVQRSYRGACVRDLPFDLN